MLYPGNYDILFSRLFRIATCVMKTRQNRLKCARSFATLHNAVIFTISLVTCAVGFAGAYMDNRFENIDTLTCRPEDANSRSIVGMELYC